MQEEEIKEGNEAANNEKAGEDENNSNAEANEVNEEQKEDLENTEDEISILIIIISYQFYG